MLSQTKFTFYLFCILLGFLAGARGISLQRTENKNGLLTAGTKRIQQHLEASRDSIASKDASNMFAENTVAKRKEHECLLAKAKTIVPLANDLIEQLKPRLIGALKARSFNIPLKMKGLSIQPVKIEHVNFKSVKIEHRGNRLKLKIKGLSLRIKKVGIRLNRKLFGLFLMQISEKAKHRRLFLRNKNSARLRKGGKKKKKGGILKKVGKAVGGAAKKVGKGIKKIGKGIKNVGKTIFHGAKSLITNRIKCSGSVWGSLGDTDFETDIYFTKGPKMAFKGTSISLRKLHIDWKVNGFCGALSSLFKKKIVGMVKSKVRSKLNTQIVKLESMLAQKVNAHPAIKGVLGVCDPDKLSILLGGLFNSRVIGNKFDVKPFVPQKIPSVDDKEAKCLMKTLTSLTAIANVFVPPLKPKLLQIIKSQSFQLPIISGLSLGKISFKKFYFKSLQFVDKGSHVDLDLNGLSVSIDRIKVQVRKTINKFGASFKINCDGWVEGGVSSSDINSHLYFGKGPLVKIDNSNLKLGDLHLNFRMNGICSLANGMLSRSLVSTKLKGFAQSFLNSQVAKMEDVISDKINDIPKIKAILGQCSAVMDVIEEMTVVDVEKEDSEKVEKAREEARKKKQAAESRVKLEERKKEEADKLAEQKEEEAGKAKKRADEAAAKAEEEKTKLEDAKSKAEDAAKREEALKKTEEERKEKESKEGLKKRAENDASTPPTHLSNSMKQKSPKDMQAAMQRKKGIKNPTEDSIQKVQRELEAAFL